MPITYPSDRYTTWSKELIVGVESVAPGTVAAGRIIKELCRTITGAKMADIEPVTGYAGVPATVFDSEQFQVHDEGSFTVDFRNGGLAALSCMTILGSEAMSGAGPYLHTGTLSATTVNIPTWTIWENRGDSANVLQRKYATLTGVTLDSGPSGGVVCTTSYTSFGRTWTTDPTPTVFVSGGTSMPKKTRQHGNAAVFNIYGASGSVYGAKVLQMTINITRPASPVPNPNGTDPLDIVPGPLDVTGSITFRYNGEGATSLVRDANAYTELGDSTHIHTVTWTDADTRTTKVSMYPLRFDDVQTQDGDTYVIGTANFISYPDMGAAIAATPALTNIKIEIQNEYNGVMIAT